MKSLNQRIFEEVLEPMNLVNFLSDGTIKGRGFNCKIYDFENNLADAFWLAEKVGLFDDYYALAFDGDNWIIQSRYPFDGLPIVEVFGEGKTVQEALCLAVLEIYGKKE